MIYIFKTERCFFKHKTTSKIFKMVSTRQQCSSSSSGSTTKVSVITKTEKSFNVNGLAQCSSSQSSPINLLDLPYEVMEKILSYTNFKHISQLRAVRKIHILTLNFIYSICSVSFCRFPVSST